MAQLRRQEMPEIDQELSLLNLLARGSTRTRKRSVRAVRPIDLETADSNEYPVLALRDTVVFPNLVSPLFIGRDRSARAVEAAEAMEVPLLVIAQRDAEVQDPGLEELYTIGTSVEIGRVLRMPDGSTTLLVQGVERVRVTELVDTEPYLRVRGIPLYEDEHHDMATEALMRAVLALFEKMIELNPNLPDDAYVAAMNEKEPGCLADLVAHVLELEVHNARSCWRHWTPIPACSGSASCSARNWTCWSWRTTSTRQVQQEVDKSQREYFLREQMRVIQTELGESDDCHAGASTSCARRSPRPGMPDEVRARAEKGAGPAGRHARRLRPKSASSAPTWTG